MSYIERVRALTPEDYYRHYRKALLSAPNRDLFYALWENAHRNACTGHLPTEAWQMLVAECENWDMVDGVVFNVTFDEDGRHMEEVTE